MFSRQQAVSPEEILQFVSFLRDSPLSGLSALLPFQQEALVPLLRHCHCRTLLPHYAPALSQLLQVLVSKTQKEPSLVDCYPQISSLLQSISRVLEPKYLRTIILDGEQQQAFKLDERQPQKESLEGGKPRMNLTCLGCADFFIENSNLLVPEVTRTDVVAVQSVLKLRIFKQELKQAVCALANSGGGVVLFDCLQQRGTLQPKGDFITEASKESIMQQIIEVFDQVVPKISFSQHVHLSFVPVAGQPKTNSQLDFQEGIYVTRLRVWNQEREKLFFYTRGDQYLLALREGDGQSRITVQLQGRALLRTIKRRFNAYYLPEDCGESEKALLSRHLHCFQDHICTEPLIGRKVSQQRNREVEETDEFVLEGQFVYVSMVVVGRVHISKVVSFLVGQKISQFQFTAPRSPFAGSNGIYTLFHDTSPYKLQQLMEQFDHPGNPLILMVDYAVKLNRKLSFQTFQELYEDLRSRQPQEFLKYYEFPLRRTEESFLETGSKVSVVYLALKLREMGFPGSKLIRLDHKNSSLKLVLSKPFDK